MARFESQADSIIGKVSEQLTALEKRDWELWTIVAVTGIVAGAAVVVLVFPSTVMHGGMLQFNFTISRELFMGLVALLILFNTYVISRRIELRRTREALISTTIQSELIRLQSFTDPLTEVYNRRMLDDMFRRYTSHARRSGKPLSLMVADVDRFKDINTRFGHLTGDFVLAEISSILRGAVRGSDAVVRYGGDEFLVILSDCTPEGAEAVCSRTAKSIHDWNKAGHLDNFELALSIGFAQWSEEKNIDQILHEADQRMYTTKDARKRAAAQA